MSEYATPVCIFWASVALIVAAAWGLVKAVRR